MDWRHKDQGGRNLRPRQGQSPRSSWEDERCCKRCCRRPPGTQTTDGEGRAGRAQERRSRLTTVRGKRQRGALERPFALCPSKQEYRRPCERLISTKFQP